MITEQQDMTETCRVPPITFTMTRPIIDLGVSTRCPFGVF